MLGKYQWVIDASQRVTDKICQPDIGHIMEDEIQSKLLNPFENFSEAERYQIFRPQYHYLPFAKLLEFNGAKFRRTLDVACGTGHSTTALQQISESVIGIDASEEMLKQARRNSGIEFLNGNAEELPFENQSFDLV